MNQIEIFLPHNRLNGLLKGISQDLSYNGPVFYPKLNLCERIIKGKKVSEFKPIANATQLPRISRMIASHIPGTIGEFGYADFKYTKPDQLYIVRLEVPEDKRNTGNGKALETALELVAKEKKCNILYGEVEKDNEAAIKFWQAMGFEFSNLNLRTLRIQKKLTSTISS